MRIHIIISFFLVLAFRGAKAQQPCFLETPTPWADSIFQSMSLDQKIGQLFMVAAWSDPKHRDYNASKISSLVKNYGIGGIIFFQGSPVRQANLTNKFQSESNIPLLISMDAEWGLGMRLDSTIAYPRQMTLGASEGDELTYEFGVEMARQLKRLGVHVSFSPVLDINNNPKNPVISNRSFGEDRDLVTRRGLMYMKGLQDNHVLAVAKHFPGHGDTDADSHKDLPVIPYSKERLDSLELYPYKALIAQGLGGSMIAHLFVPALDTTKNLPSTLSPKIINGLLREEMGFDGLVFTDALNMQGVAKFWKPGDMDLQAIKAGNDVLLFSADIPLAIQKIKEAIANGELTEAEINDRCLRILRTKEWVGLSNFTPIKTKGLVEDLNSASAKNLQAKLVEQSLTVIRNEKETLPINFREYKKVAVVEIGAGAPTAFTAAISKYLPVDVFMMEKNPEYKSAMAWYDKLSEYDLVIADMVGTSNKASKNFGVTNESARILNGVGEKTTVVLAVLANPYSLSTLRDLSNIEGVVVAYQDDELTRKACAELIVGATDASGALPVTATADFVCKDGCKVDGGGILRWANLDLISQTLVNVEEKTDVKGAPAADYEEDMMDDAASFKIAINSNSFSKVDSIAWNGVMQGAYPGCRVLVAKDGWVVYDKAFGSLNWDSSQAVDQNTVYDLASITKVASGTLAAMKLVDEKKLDVNKTLGDYLDIPQENAYSKVVIKEMLAHTAGFTAWIPFYTKTMSGGALDPSIYKSTPERGFSNQVAEGIYIKDDYKKEMMKQVLDTPISADKSYKYSDLAFYFTQELVEKISNQPLDQYVTNHFYKPMGLHTIGYKPLERMDKSVIAPTENDKVFRDQHITGYVHDQGAAMLGGVAGHAGLFSNAQDLAAIMQMLMNKGVYGDKTYISDETIRLFNTRHFAGNRRGLGFDKPAFTKGTGSSCAQATPDSFGHTGFTGTMCWADPETGIVYIFLSNRVNPDAENKKLLQLDIRTRIQSEVYRVLGYAK